MPASIQPKWLDSAAFGLSTAADALMAAVLIVTLRQNRTGFKRYVRT